ncbi:MAG: hypothetical protein ACXADS_15405 [Candidatus Thorarchaeota archaeon]|jgi:hypothetical protein
MTVKFIHIRNTETVPDGTVRAAPKGGMTIAYKHSGDLVHLAVSVCCERDHFNTKLGRLKAESRLKSANPKWCKKINSGGNYLQRVLVVGKVMGINLAPSSVSMAQWMTKRSIGEHNKKMEEPVDLMQTIPASYLPAAARFLAEQRALNSGDKIQ